MVMLRNIAIEVHPRCATVGYHESVRNPAKPHRSICVPLHESSWRQRSAGTVNNRNCMRVLIFTKILFIFCVRLARALLWELLVSA